MSDIPRIPISLGFSTNEQEAIKLLEKTFNKLQSKLDGETITYDLKCDESKLKNTLKELQKLGIKDLKIQVDNKEIANLQKALSDIIKEANTKGISIKINGFDKNKIENTIQSLKELNEVQESLNKAQLTLDENFTKSNKKDATSQLKQAKEYVNQIRQLEKNGGNIAEFNRSEEGAIAGYKYAKAYMEAVRQGIAESRLKSYGITGDIFKDKEEVQLLLSSSEKILKDFSSEYQNVIKKINSTKIDSDITKKIEEIVYYKDLLRYRQEDGLFNEAQLQEDKDLIHFLQQSLEDLIKTKQQAAKNTAPLLQQENSGQTSSLQHSEQAIKSQEKLQQEIKETNTIIKEQINLDEHLNNTQKQPKENIVSKKLSTNLNIDFNTLESRFKSLNSNILSSGLSSEKLSKSIKEIQTILNNGADNQTTESIKELREQLKLANAEYNQLNTNANIENKGKIIDYKSIQEAVKAYETMGYAIKNIKANSFTASMKQANGAIETVTITANKAGNVLRATTNIAPFKNLTKEANAFSWVYSGLLKTAQQFLRIYLSPMDFIRYFRNGVNILKEYDNALTTISYTMDVNKNKLDVLGENVLQLANDTKTSVKDALAISQIYANMDTTPKKIVELATPTVVLKNLTGADASTTSDQIQAVVQQFGILEEESMHIADVYDYISSRVAIDYSKGIENISEAVKVAGSTASEAGLSFEQLSAITAKIAERTRMEGSSIGNGLKTIFTRTSKVGELSDEVDNETLSKASESLHQIGIEVYNLDGSYRKFDTIMQELSSKWDDLTDAERANLSYNIAATRQTNLLSALLETYSDSMQLATEAQQTSGNALANQAKYVESYSAKIQGLSTAMQTFGVHFLNTEAFKVLLDVVTSLVNGIDDLVRNFGALSVVIPVFAITTFVKNFTQLKSIGESLTALNSINKVLADTSLSLGSRNLALDAIGKQYSTTTLKAAIAQSQLNKEQIKTILSANGLQGELLETTADELANAASTNLVAKSQTEATLTTTSLSNAFKGLIASIKGLATAHPIISTVSIALAAIGSIAYVISDLAKAEKKESDAKLELFEKSKEKVQANKNETKSLNELIEKYKELSSKSNINSDDRDEIKEIQNDIIDLVGTEAQRLDLVNGKLENQLNILKNISAEKSKQNVEDARDNYYNAAYSSDVMVGSADDYGNDVAIKWDDTEAAQIHKIKGFEHIAYDEFIKYIRDNGFGDIFRENYDKNIFNLKFVVDTTDIDGLENKVKRLTEFKDFLADNGLTSTGLYQGVSNSIEQYQTQRNNEIESANILVDSVVENLAKSNNELAEINVDSLETFEQYRQKLINEVKNDDSINKALVDGVLSNDNLETAVNNFMATSNEFSTWYQQWKDNINDSTSSNDVLFDKSFDKMNKDFQELTENAELLFSINKEISEIGRVSAENLSKIAEAFPEDKYPEMTKALYEYQLGLISVQDLFAELEVCYENDKNNYIQSLVEKSEVDEQYFLLMREKYPQIFEELTEMYGKDVENWKSIAKAKEEIDSILIKSLSNKWGQYFHAIMGSDGKYSLLSSGFDDSDIALTNPATAEKLNQEYTEYQEIAQGFIDDANYALELLDKISYTPTDFNLGDLSWKGLGNSSNSNSSSDSNTAKDYDLIERAIQKLEREISNLDTIVNDTFISWNERNTALFSQIDKINEKINTQQAAYEQYMSLANSVGLDSYYQNLIKNGSIDVITITDKNLQNQIDTFQDFYDKALEAQDSIQELQSRLNELDKTKFDNVVKQFENIQDNISHTINIIDKKLNLIEEKGFFANSSIYENLISQYEKQLRVLYDKHDKLTMTLNNSDIQEGTQAWNELKQQINAVNESIIDTIISIEQFSNELNKNEFSKFDYFQDKISKLVSESDFYIDLMESMDKKTVDENGNYTDEGWTNAGLHAQNYNAYLKQAEEYALKIDSINKQLETDPYNTILLKQKQQYIEAQRESILAAYEEKNAIKDLIKAGYEEQSNSLNKIIDKYKDLLNSMKEAHDYEKNIKEQTENLANLNKQYLATLGDDSESSRKNIQQLENDIREAQEELQETQYEKLISDTEKLLDDLQSDYEELMNQRLDDIDTELINIYSGINENANIIKDTLHQLSTDTNLLLSEEITDIWNNAQPVIDLNNSVNTVNENISGTNSAIDNLRNSVEAILSKMDMIINEQMNQVETVDSNSTTYTPTIEPSNNIPNYSNYNMNDSDNNSDYYNDDWWKYKQDYYPKEQLNIETSIVDRLKWHDYDSSYSARATYYEKMGLGSSDEYYSDYNQNVAMLSWMKINGYANGSKYIKKRQLAFTQEKGSEMIYDKSTGAMLTPISMEQFIHSLQQKSGTPTYLETGDKVFTNQMSENLWKIAKNPYDFGVDIKPDLDYDISTMTASGNRSNNIKIEFGDVHVTLPNVKNYQEFMQQAQADTNFAKMIENIALGKAFGANTFDKFTFR